MIRWTLFFCFLFLASFSCLANDYANDKDIAPKHILVLHSYHQSMGWVAKINEAIKNVLKPSENNYILHVENMDSKRIYSPEHLQQLKATYKSKYQHIKFDLILSSDNNAFDFLKENRDELFGHVPVSFCGVNFFKPSDLDGLSNFTGASEVFDAKTTVEQALKLLPHTKKIYIVNDYLKTGRAWEKSIKSQLATIDKKIIQAVELTYADNLSMPALQKEIAHLSKDSIVLLGVYFKDKDGKYFTYEKTGELLSQSSQVPIFCLLEFNLQKGVVGGSVIGGYYQGEAMAKIGLEILSGTAADSIPVLQSGATKLIYDHPSLIAHNINLDDVDKKALILNRKVSFWNEYKVLLSASISIILFLSAIIIILLFLNKKRKQAEKQFRQLSEHLEVTITERTRELTQLKERMELALIGNNDGLWDWQIDSNSVYFSPRWKEILGYEDTEFSNEFINWEKRVHPDDIDSVMQDVQNNIEGKTNFFENTHRLKHKNGHWVWILARAKTLYDENGNAVRMTGTHTDITAEKVKQLKFSHQAQMIEQTHDGVVSTDLKGRIVSWNLGAEKLFGYTAEETIGKQLDILFKPQDKRLINISIAFLLKKGDINVERELLQKSNLPIFVSISVSILKEESGKAINLVGYIEDITHKKEAERALKEQHNYLQSIIDGIDDPIMVIKADYNIEIMNNSLASNLNHDELADPNHPKCYEVSHHRSTPCDGMDHPCPLKLVINTNSHTNVVHEHLNDEGNKRYVELSASPLFDQDKNCVGIIESSRDITSHLAVQHELRKQKNLLDFQAHHDVLTGLPNRVLFNDRLNQAIQKSKRNKTKMALLFIDLDHFKEINDSLGHDIGDEVLKIATERLDKVTRNEDTLARLGGDEFTIVMEDLLKGVDASVLAQKVIKIIEKPIIIGEHNLYISSSIGISVYPDDSLYALDLLKFSDTAMYKAKEEGRNNFQYYSSEMTELAFERVVMEAELRRAISYEEFTVYYQPQINGEDDHLIGMEALVRWEHPVQGLISPAKFIPLAELTGLIIELDQLVMKTAMTQIAQWYKQDLKPGRLALNLAIKQLQQKNFISILKQLLKETGCKPEWIELEVTEGQIMTHPEEAIKILEKVSAMGIQLAVDDFGTGYSSLSYLKKLPINKLKIDQSFVRDIPDDEEDSAIVKAVIALAQNLNLEIIAEGVETLTQKDFLVANGCHDIQGYFYHKPMPAEQMDEYLQPKNNA